MLSVIINTCALGPSSEEVRGSGGKSSLHAWRRYALRNFILPLYTSRPINVIVVGEWEPGPYYRYLHVPSQYFSCVDALHQRQVAFEAARLESELFLFQHDDHAIFDLFFNRHADVFSPRRWTHLRSAEAERLNSGEDDGYICGHAAIYRREVLERCPWGNVPPVFTWDVEHTKQIQAAGFKIAWDAFDVYDVEFGAEPWK